VAYVLNQIQERGIIRDIKTVELVFQGFGNGRDATIKALMGTEGRFLRPKVVRVTDATKLRFGGTRGKKPRRL
jgi:small subunit ribosomal protein S11